MNRKLKFFIIVLSLYFMTSCSSNKEVRLQGTYQYVSDNAEVYQMTFDKDSFVSYKDGKRTYEGSYEKDKNNVGYILKYQDFRNYIVLNKDKGFNYFVETENSERILTFEFLGSVPTYFDNPSIEQ